jgi:hypothetical protein
MLSSNNTQTVACVSVSAGTRLRIFDVFNVRCLETGVWSTAYCVATAMLVVRFEVSCQQRLYTPQYICIHYVRTYSACMSVNVELCRSKGV